MSGMGQEQAEPVWSRASAGRGSGWDKRWGEGSVCPTPVSCSDTSFITGRKEAISMGGLQLHRSLAQPSPSLPPLLHVL